MSLTSSPIDWYAARAGGIVAYLLLTAVVLLGLTLASRKRLAHWPRFAITDVHRFAGLLAAAFISIHLLAIGLDSYTPFSLSQLVVPFTAHYRPLWTALGIVAAELLFAVGAANAVRTRIPYRWWRRTHMLTFVVWGAATAHGIGAGTDTPTGWMTLLFVACVASVLAALAWRLARGRLATPHLAGLVAAAGVLGTAAVVALGDLPHGGHAKTDATGLPVRLAERFAGSLSQSQGTSGARLLSIVGRGAGSRPVLVRIDLLSPDGDTFSASALQLEDLASGSICTGTVSSIGDSGFTGSCAFASGAARTVVAIWQLEADRLRGSLDLTA